MKYLDIKFRFNHRSMILDIKRFFRWRWERSQRGWSQRDYWNFDKYLATIISETAKNFALIGDDPEYTSELLEMAEGFDKYAYNKNGDQLNKSLKLFRKHFQSFWI